MRNLIGKPNAVLHQVRLTQYLDRQVQGKYSDWPAALQDRFGKALFAEGLKDRRNYEIIDSGCTQDIDGGWYAWVGAVARSKMQ